MKLTEESAQKVKQFGLMDTKTPGVSHDPGRTREHHQAVDPDRDARIDGDQPGVSPG